MAPIERQQHKYNKETKLNISGAAQELDRFFGYQVKFYQLSSRSTPISLVSAKWSVCRGSGSLSYVIRSVCVHVLNALFTKSDPAGVKIFLTMIPKYHHKHKILLKF